MRGGIGLFALVFLLGASAHAQALLAGGGDGDSGGDGGEIVIRASDAVLAGGKAKAKAPKAPKVTTKPELTAADLDTDLLVELEDLDASPADLDPDDFEVTVRGDVLVPSGTTLSLEADGTIVSTQGGVYVQGSIADNGGGTGGVDLNLISLRKAVVVLGNIDLDGENAATGGDGGNLDLAGAQVSIAGSAVVSARGGNSSGGGNDGGDAGSVEIRPANPVIHGSIAAQIGADADVVLPGGESGTGGGADGGAGGDFEVNYSDVLGNASTFTMAGSVGVRGGAAQAGAGSGGDAGSIDVDVGGALAVTGVLDASGGAGAAGADGGDGGSIGLGSQAAGKGPVSIVVPGATTVNASVDGGDGSDGNGGAGGFFSVEADLRGIQWNGNLSALGGASVDDDGADGGEIDLVSWGPSGSSLLVNGNLSAQGSDADVDGDGSAGGTVLLVSLDGPLEVTGTVNTSAGDAVGNGNDADPAGAGPVQLVVDDGDAAPGNDQINLLDDVGGNLVLLGSVSATGGNGGGGDSNGSDGGEIAIEADSEDGEEDTNGTVELGDGVAVDASGGNGSGAGDGGDGGDIFVRGSNGDADGAVSGVIQGAGVSITSAGGAGGTAGAAGTIVVD